MKSSAPLNIKIPKIWLNAEHQRQIWLNFSYNLLIAITALYAFFIYLAFDGSLTRNLTLVGTFGYIISNIILIILLRRSISNDIQSNFWDQLRMSSLSSWQMTWTRLISATSLAWISIFISSLILIAAMVIDIQSNIEVGLRGSLDLFHHLGVGQIFLVLLLNSWLLSCTYLLNYLQFNRSSQEWQGSLLQIVLLIFLSSYFITTQVYLLESLQNESDVGGHLLGLSIIFAVFFGLGVWRSMAYKLHLQSSKLYWLIATLALPVILWLYCAVFIQSDAPFLVYLSLVYGYAIVISITTSDNRFPVLKQGLQKLKQQQWLDAVHILPTWMILFPIWLILSLFYGAEHLENYLYSVFFIISYATIVLLSVKFNTRFNAITLAIIWFLVLRFILAIL